MKKLLVLGIFGVLWGFDVKAQKTNEFGLTFKNLDNFGVVYKVGSTSNLFRITALSVGVSINDVSPSSISLNDFKQTNFSIGLGLGGEHRFGITENFNFILGFQGVFSIYSQKIDYNKLPVEYGVAISKNEYSNNRIALQGIAGVNYTISNNLSISVEVYPGYVFSKTKSTSFAMNNLAAEVSLGTQEDKGHGFEINSTSAMLTIAYRW